ncbi:hypothetical protein EDC01DRAFT_665825 [Geopyxis carbonaria]|nr:hypothetical protein EDC01DRAFT_665825 [Geopyxis carbonaria]
MGASQGLSKRALTSPVKFNGEFLWLLVICGLLATLFLFYFNRLFAKIVSFLARLYLRSIGNPRYVDVESIQISPLAGRIFFGKTTYHGPNETITVVGGHITWRYWLRRVRHVLVDKNRANEDYTDGNEKDKSGKLPCRILVELKGVEWFVYNRSPAYDGIVTAMEEQANRDSRENDIPSTPTQKSGNRIDEEEDGKQLQTPKTGSTTLAPGSSHQRTADNPTTNLFEEAVAGSYLLQMLPIKLECSKGAMVMGNKNIPSVLVAQFEKAVGTIDATKSRSIDQYKQIYDLSFTHPVVHLKPNTDFKETLLSKGRRLKNPNQSLPHSNRQSQNRSRRQKLLDLLPIFSTSVESIIPPEGAARASQEDPSGQRRWMGLRRYLDDSERQSGRDSEPAEYAKETTILDCENANLCYWYDVVSTVPTCTSDVAEGPDYINGSPHPSPEYGVEIKFKNANLNYGPWADRQRIHLQNMFFPKSYITPRPTKQLVPGQLRLHTELNLFVELSGSTTLRIPVREATKDWKYKRRLEEGETRPYGWIDLKVGNESTVSYIMDMYPSRNGWNSIMNLELRNPEVSSSVNHKLLWKAENQTLQCDLSAPLIWNTDTKWIFNNVSTDMQVFLLREHVTLLTDLVSDWISGPTAEYWTFVPMVYQLNLVLKNSEFFFNVNDQNIINNANSFEDNTFVILRNLGGDKGYLSGTVNMDFREFCPQSSTVEFLVETISLVENGGSLDLGVMTPLWNTWNCSLKNQTSLGKVGQVKLKGSYEFYSSTGPDLIDCLTLDLDGEDLELILHGFLLRYFLTIKENYFGENVHFKTLEEWQRTPTPPNNADPTEQISKSNDIDIVLGVKAKDIIISLPKNIYEAQQHIKLNVPTLGLDMRFTNYYMDLQIDLSPISALLGNSLSAIPEIFINGVTLYGHRLFGLPPTEPTYVCNWDIDVGSVSGECSLEFLQTSLFALKALVFSFGDVENALPVPTTAAIHDVTFLRLNVSGVKLWLHMADDAVLRVATDAISVVLNDLADETHSERVTLKIPGLNLICMNPLMQSSQATTAYLETEVNVTLLERKKDALVYRRLQQKHIRESDYRTGRAKFLLTDDDDNESRNHNSAEEGPPPASMSLPALPPKAFDFGYGNRDFASSISSGQKSSRSFFERNRTVLSSRSESVLNSTSSHDGSSFHSAVESFSDLALATPNTHLFASSPSPTVTTPGSKSSNYASRFTTKGKQHTLFEMTPQPLDVAFKSAFIQPKFPLDSLEPDLSSVPSLEPDILEPDSSKYSKPINFTAVYPNDETARDSFILEFSPGIRGYCTPNAIKGLASLLEHIEPTNPEDVLDMIQIEVVSKLQKIVKKVSPHSADIEICLRIPLFKFCFVNESVGEHLSGRHAGLQLRSKDSICIQFRNLAISGRDRKTVKPADTSGSEQEEIKKMWSLHATLDSLDVGLKDVMKSSTEFSTPVQPALGVLVQNLLFWASSSDSSTACLQIGSLATSIQGKQALFLYDASMRFAAVAQQIAGHFENLASTQKSRIRKLLSDLASAGEQFRITQDPASLTRPSYVLRSAPDHVRLNDSWKISLRLRHIWQSLPEGERMQRNSMYVGNVNEPPQDARNVFIEVIERWRPWELGSIKDSIMIKHIFGDSGRSSTPGPIKKLSLGAKITIDGITVLIDPGPSQHEFTVDQFHGCIMVGCQPTNKMGGQEAVIAIPGIGANIVVQASTRNIRLGLRWEGLEIIEKVAKDLWERKQQAGHSVPPGNTLSKPKSKQNSSRHGGIHIIFTTDDSSVSLDTVNLKILSMVGGLKASAVISEKSTELQEGNIGHIGSLLLQADYVTTEICYGNKILSKAMIWAPTLYGYFDEHSFAETEFNIWKVTGSSEDLSFEIREQILGLMEVVDFIVNDEAAQIYRYMEEMKRHQPVDATPPSTPLVKRIIHMIHGTFSLNRFTLSATLLPSLSYLVRGEGVRLSTNPNPNDSNEIVVDFDLKHHEHEVRTSTKSSEARSISLLQLPTIIATTRYKETEHERLLEARVSVQAIILDASSIQSLLNALNKPEVVKVIESSRNEWTGIEARLDEIFESSKKRQVQEKDSGPPLKYEASIGVAGLKIQTSAPSANLEINLGFIKSSASNRSQAALSYPVMKLEFGKITLELTRKSPENLKELCGYLELHASLEASSKQSDQGTIRIFNVRSDALKIDLYASTASTVVDVIGHLQDKLRDLDLSREVKYLRRLRTSKPAVNPDSGRETPDQSTFTNTQMSVNMNEIRVSWIVGSGYKSSTYQSNQNSKHNLVLSFKKIDFTTMTRKDSEAQLIIEEFLLQMVKAEARQSAPRTENSALLPRVRFGVTYSTKEAEIQLTFQAKGEPLDLRLTSSCVAAASEIESSISTATQKFRDASANWKSIPTQSGVERKSMFGSKRLGALSVDADFAGAVVYLSGQTIESRSVSGFPGVQPTGSRYGQFTQGKESGNTVLKSPGLAFKVRYLDAAEDKNEPCLNAEINISASENTLSPKVVPLILEMSRNVQEVMKQQETKQLAQKEEDATLDSASDTGSSASSNPAAILGKCRLNIGFRIRPQEFTLSCQPYARVAATAKFKGIYITVNTCEDDKDASRFYAVSATISGLRASLQHVYSRESTGSLEVETVVLSLMNNKHLMGSQGISCILKLSPIKSQVNVKQFQDFLLFREIWVPPELREKAPVPTVSSEGPSTMLVQKYHEVAATKAFPSNTTIIIEELELQLDLSQSLGKSKLLVSNLWATSRKTSDWEQTMCLGFDSIRIESFGRLGGFIDLKNMKVRTSISWDSAMDASHVQVPLIEAAVGFKQLQAKISYEYYTFLIADITSFDFLMYNLQTKGGTNEGDRLVAVLDGDKVQVFCTTVTAALGLQLYQVFQKLIQEKRDSLDSSMKEVEQYLNRRSSHSPSISQPQENLGSVREDKSPSGTLKRLSLHTDVMVNLKEVHIGAFSQGFYDNQVFKLEALNATARFAVEMRDEKIRSMLQMTLGHLAVAVSPVKHQNPGTNAEVDVHDVINAAISSKGGIILKVPQVQAKMETAHTPESNTIDYIFKSAFEGQVDVGWNFSRVGYIKGMWQKHSKEFLQQQGKSPFSSRISLYTDMTPNSPTSSEPPTGSDDSKDKDKKDKKAEKGKITAVVNVPKSKYEYNALEPPIIETPQLREMGEATPPLEWIGLHRDRLPNLTHQIVIVPLLEVAKKVEDSYSKILGSS